MKRLFFLTSSILLITLISTLGIGYAALNNLITVQQSSSQQSTALEADTNTKTLGVETQVEEHIEAAIPYATFIVNAGEGIISSYMFYVDENTSAYSLLEKAQEMGEVEIVSEQYDFGVFVKSINGFESSNNKAWIYFVNGESGQVAADQQLVNPGDTVEWKYVEPSF